MTHPTTSRPRNSPDQDSPDERTEPTAGGHTGRIHPSHSPVTTLCLPEPYIICKVLNAHRHPFILRDLIQNTPGTFRESIHLPPTNLPQLICDYQFIFPSFSNLGNEFLKISK